MLEKISYTVKKSYVEEVDINYPFYTERDYGGDNYSSIYYYKVVSRYKAYVIEKSYVFGSDDVEFKFTIVNRDMLQGDNVDFMLGKGLYKSSKKEFDSVLNELKKHIAEL